MKASFKFNEGKLVRDVSAIFDEVKEPTQNAMAQTFEFCVMRNFGFTGFERPNEWPLLSPAYAKRVGRTVATLELTGAMEAELKTEGNVVSLSDETVKYALKHENAIGVPRRSVFPMVDGECLPRTYTAVLDAAQEELKNILV
jgi:hypothetical protein